MQREITKLEAGLAAEEALMQEAGQSTTALEASHEPIDSFLVGDPMHNISAGDSLAPPLLPDDEWAPPPPPPDELWKQGQSTDEDIEEGEIRTAYGKVHATYSSILEGTTTTVDNLKSNLAGGESEDMEVDDEVEADSAVPGLSSNDVSILAPIDSSLVRDPMYNISVGDSWAPPLPPDDEWAPPPPPPNEPPPLPPDASLIVEPVFMHSVPPETQLHYLAPFKSSMARDSSAGGVVSKAKKQVTKGEVKKRTHAVSAAPIIDERVSSLVNKDYTDEEKRKKRRKDKAIYSARSISQSGRYSSGPTYDEYLAKQAMEEAAKYRLLQDSPDLNEQLSHKEVEDLLNLCIFEEFTHVQRKPPISNHQLNMQGEFSRYGKIPQNQQLNLQAYNNDELDKKYFGAKLLNVQPRTILLDNLQKSSFCIVVPNTWKDDKATILIKHQVDKIALAKMKGLKRRRQETTPGPAEAARLTAVAGSQRDGEVTPL